MKTLLVIALLASGTVVHANGLKETVTNLCKSVFFIDYIETRRLEREEQARLELHRSQQNYKSRIEHYTRELYRVAVPRAPIPNPVPKLRENLRQLTKVPDHWAEDILKEENHILASAIARGAYGRDVLEDLIRWGEELSRDINLHTSGQPTKDSLDGLRTQFATVQTWIAKTSGAVITRRGTGLIVNDPFIVRFQGKLIDLANTPFEKLSVEVRSVFEAAARLFVSGYPTTQINHVYDSAFQNFLISEKAAKDIRPY